MATSHFHLPRTLDSWPWPRQINPHYEEVKLASDQWFRSFNAFGPKAQAAFERCNFSLLASLAYPTLDKERLRTSCDIMMLFFVFDEYTDEENAREVRQHADIVMDALRNPHNPRPEKESILGEIARQCWVLAVKTASPSSQRRFIAKFAQYTESIVEQAEDRDHRRVRHVADYLYVRRRSIGAEPSYALMELAMNLPDEVIDHPDMVSLSLLVTDMIILDNDICSYNKEQAVGDGLHNIVTVVMQEFQTDIDGAMTWVAERHAQIAEIFLQSWEGWPHWGGELDADVHEYVQGLANWVRANDCWNFESGRYFGSMGPEIKEHRIVRLTSSDVNMTRPS